MRCQSAVNEAFRNLYLVLGLAFDGPLDPEHMLTRR